jgi:hypothetical protein
MEIREVTTWEDIPAKVEVALRVLEAGDAPSQVKYAACEIIMNYMNTKEEK